MSKLAFVPPADDVESEAAAADVIGSHHFLGGDERIEHRRMHCAEAGDAFGLAEQAAGPVIVS